MQENQINQTSNTDEISQENSQEDNQESNDDNNNATSNTSNTNNQPLPDINISSAQYTKENHSITVGICQSQANYNNEIHTTLSLSYGEDQWNKQMPVVVPQGA